MSINIRATNNTNCYLTLWEVKSPNQSLETKVKVLVSLIPSVEPQQESSSFLSDIPRMNTLLDSWVPPPQHASASTVTSSSLWFIWATVLTCGLQTSFYNPLINYTYQNSFVREGTLFTGPGDADVDSLGEERFVNTLWPLSCSSTVTRKPEDSSLNMYQI